ncbi:MAG: diguanylate cyclase [Desulfocapsa sp.]|nr:diguanylate cyclase [Desulfocapsa sp.]
MNFSTSSIRSKIWLCVLIALIGFLVATMSSFYANIKQYQNLSQLQKEYYPLASLGLQLMNTLELQTEGYEDAFMIGEQSLAVEANEIKGKILALIDNILNFVRNSSSCPLREKDIMAIRQEYLTFATLAEKIYSHPGIENLSRDKQKEIRELGLMQGALMQGFKSISDQLDNSLIGQIEKTKKKSLSTMVLLGSLFITAFLLVGLIVDRVASRLLVTPLSRIRDNIKRFSLGQNTIQPPAIEDSDEIGHLAMAFWEMTEDLKITTVSKRYVDNIIRNMSGALIVLKPDMTIQTVSQQTVELFSYTEEELLGLHMDVLFSHGDDDEISADKIASIVVDGAVKTLEATCRTREGHVFPAHFSGSSMYNEAGELQGIICVFNDITELKNAEKKLTEMAHYDTLTGLANRNLFFQSLDHAILDAKRHNRILALLYLDLDKFKPINDRWSHDIGDLVLQEIGKRLEELTRADDTVARMGGDEFIVLLNSLNEAGDAERIAEKIIGKIAEPIQINKYSHILGVSVGISIFPANGDSMEDLIVQADMAMYQAKKNGGSCLFNAKNLNYS